MFFSPNIINEWSKLDIKITNITSHIKLNIRMNISHLNEHKFNPLCACNLELETTSLYLLWYRSFHKEQRTPP